MAKQLFNLCPEIKAKLCVVIFGQSRYYANTVGKYWNKGVIKRYVETQGKTKEYKKLYEGQLCLFN